MALKSCPDCKREVSATADSCPGCGCRFADRRADRVTVTGIDIPFWSLVEALVLISLASIPAIIIVTVVLFLVGAVLAIAVASLGIPL